jgi:xylan 1,4-beta-xylosidase
VFTDIFEEAGPRFTPFHGGFGLLNYQDIRKPTFFAYQFLNRLGPTELASSDPSSFVTTDGKGNFQILFWDFTVANPAKAENKSENNQTFYKRDLPAVSKGTAKLHLGHLPPGRYLQTVYQVGYRANDAYAIYKDMGSPAQLTRAQVANIHAGSDGKPVSQSTVTIRADGIFEHQLPLRENDVFLVTLSSFSKRQRLEAQPRQGAFIPGQYPSAHASR